MRVLYDHQIFHMQKFGGISRYFVELMSRLPKDVMFNNKIVFTENVYLRDADDRFSKGIAIPQFRGRNRFIGPVNKLLSDMAISKGEYDLFHPTYYNPYFLRHLKRPYVITVHDMIHEKFSDMFAKDDPTRAYKKETIVNADKVIAISQNTKDDIINLYGLPEDKIEVVYLGHSVNNNTVSEVENLPTDYILYVGQRGGYKNFARLLRAFSNIHRSFPEVKLVCTGSPFNSEENQLINTLGVKDDVMHYFVTDSQLTYLYQHALCFVYPSLYEGFGIPILEAFAAKCPLALSDTSCFPEIARNGGAYFNPYEVDNIADTLTEIISDGELRKEMIAKGTDVLSLYSWDKMASETAEIYKSVI